MELQSIGVASVTLRLVMAAVFGGVIGLERETTRHPAGLRTHMLICIGSALVMITGQFAFQTISPTADPTRIGAQVISGIGFLGVGTILVVGRQHVRGLTTAAGLWASACMGLAIGIGFYLGAVVAGVLIFVILTLLHRFDGLISRFSRRIDLYLEVDDSSRMREIEAFFAGRQIAVTNVEMSREGPVCAGTVGVTVTLRTAGRVDHLEVVTALMKQDWVRFVQEI